MKYAREEKFIKSLGKHIRKLRIANNLTQNQLAFEAGLNLSQVSRIERGLINTSVTHIYLIAQVLDLHPKALLDFK
ncbi:MAG: helix-turn-helix transcriptional regulator [Bacteroidia bacterium]|nr:helix-turn-helix transcriptional regulator [Bacteroidia bacterium]